MKYEVSTTEAFDDWVRDLKDRQAVLAIAKRIDRAIKGNLGDISPVGSGVNEMRIFFGPGYRIYFTQRGGELIILLCGGDKTSQQRDIQKAIELAKNL